MTGNFKGPSEQAVEARTGREVRDLLRELYVEKRWTDEEIASELSVNRVTVTTWRSKYRISQADRRTVA